MLTMPLGFFTVVLLATIKSIHSICAIPINGYSIDLITLLSELVNYNKVLWNT